MQPDQSVEIVGHDDELVEDDFGADIGAAEPFPAGYVTRSREEEPIISPVRQQETTAEGANRDEVDSVGGVVEVLEAD